MSHIKQLHTHIQGFLIAGVKYIAQRFGFPVNISLNISYSWSKESAACSHDNPLLQVEV